MFRVDSIEEEKVVLRPFQEMNDYLNESQFVILDTVDEVILPELEIHSFW